MSIIVRGKEIPQTIEDECPYHTRLLNSVVSKNKMSLNTSTVEDYKETVEKALKILKVEDYKEIAEKVRKIIKEDTMKDRMQIDGIWYKREDTLLKTDETLRIISVEPFYRESGEYLRLMFDMPSAKFNVGDELAIHNLTKLRELKEKSFAKIQKGY